MYLDAVLWMIGSRDLMNCCYPQLNDEVERTSTSGAKILSRGNRRHKHIPAPAVMDTLDCASDQEQDQEHTNVVVVNNTRTKKHAAVEATKEAAEAIEERNNNLIEDQSFDRLLCEGKDQHLGSISTQAQGSTQESKEGSQERRNRGVPAGRDQDKAQQRPTNLQSSSDGIREAEECNWVPVTSSI